VDTALEAMRVWRAAPARMTPMLTGLLRDERPGIRSAALRALAASPTASRLAADALAALLDDAEAGTTAATALGSVGDHRAVPHLVRLLLANSDEPRLLQAFRAVARSGADPEAPVTAARQILAAHPGPSAPELPMWVLAAFGPAAAAAVPELIAAVVDAPSRLAVHVLGRIGPAAAAALPVLRGCPEREVTFALLRITSDRTVADRRLAALPDEPGHNRSAAMLLTWLAEHDGLTARQHRQLRSLFRSPGSGQVESAGALWLHEGPAVAAELLEVLPRYLTDDLYAPTVLRVFAAMGAHARPMLGRLDEFATARHRAAFTFSTAEAEMYADELVLDAVIDARERIQRASSAVEPDQLASRSSAWRAGEPGSGA
jgi:hypothetical protein